MARRTSPTERTVSPATFRRITLAVLVTQVVIVLTGAAVRLTGSGLGCSNWPNCTEERLVAPVEYHAVIEFVNRLVSFPVVAAVVLAVWAAARRSPFRRELRTLPVLILVGVVVQVLVGAVVVRLELLPSTVILHFLLSMLLIGTSVVLHHRADPAFDGPALDGPALDGPALDGPGAGEAEGATRSRGLVTALLVGATAVLVTGTIVTGAGPHGGDEQAERLDVFLPTATRVHSLTVWAFLALLVVTLLVVRADRAPASALRAGTLVLAVSLVQGSIGYLQYWNGVPEALVMLHIVGAMAVWGTTIWFWLEHGRARAAASDPVVTTRPVVAGGGR